jgi:hypothetical protein
VPKSLQRRSQIEFKCDTMVTRTYDYKLYCRGPKIQKKKKTVSSPMQTGHIGSSVDPAGGVVATSEEGVYCTAAINRTWHTSLYTMETRVNRQFSNDLKYDQRIN